MPRVSGSWQSWQVDQNAARAVSWVSYVIRLPRSVISEVWTSFSHCFLHHSVRIICPDGAEVTQPLQLLGGFFVWSVEPLTVSARQITGLGATASCHRLWHPVRERSPTRRPFLCLGMLRLISSIAWLSNINPANSTVYVFLHSGIPTSGGNLPPWARGRYSKDDC